MLESADLTAFIFIFIRFMRLQQFCWHMAVIVLDWVFEETFLIVSEPVIVPFILCFLLLSITKVRFSIF